jgi:nucleoside-triphosphatase THEP1
LDSEGREVGKSALCIAAGESWQIARVDVELDGPRLGRFSFSARGMERAVACLCAALGESSLICVIDEIGPLELDRGMGFSPVLPLLASAGRLLIVARPGLSQRISAHIPRHDTRTIVMDAGNRGETRLEIARLLRR